jgi:hypothetical protein
MASHSLRWRRPIVEPIASSSRLIEIPSADQDQPAAALELSHLLGFAFVFVHEHPRPRGLMRIR